MATMRKLGSEDARNTLPSLLKAAEKGRPTAIMRYGKVVAVIMPADALGKAGGKPAPGKSHAKKSKGRRRK